MRQMRNLFTQEILVASSYILINYNSSLIGATNPGWTPLFVNASAIILEVGGLLQLGSLVAREYGLPCFVGIEKATSLFKDGQLIEVDGSTGIIRFISEDTVNN